MQYKHISFGRPMVAGAICSDSFLVAAGQLVLAYMLMCAEDNMLDYGYRALALAAKVACSKLAFTQAQRTRSFEDVFSPMKGVHTS